MGDLVIMMITGPLPALFIVCAIEAAVRWLELGARSEPPDED